MSKIGLVSYNIPGTEIWSEKVADLSHLTHFGAKSTIPATHPAITWSMQSYQIKPKYVQLSGNYAYLVFLNSVVSTFELARRTYTE